MGGGLYGEDEVERWVRSGDLTRSLDWLVATLRTTVNGGSVVGLGVWLGHEMGISFWGDDR